MGEPTLPLSLVRFRYHFRSVERGPFPFYRLILTAILPIGPLSDRCHFRSVVVPSEDHLVVWQAESGLTCGETLEPGELCKRTNERISLPENFEKKGIPPKQMAELENRRIAVIAYHLCRGLDWFSDYISKRTRVAPDGTITWLGGSEL